MEQFRQVGEVLGGLKAIMVLKHEIPINQRQCCLLYDMMQLAFDTISEEIRQYMRLDEKNFKWKALELPMKELHKVFRDADYYIRYCIDVKDWWGKAISLHMNRECVEFHVHNLLSCFPIIIEAIETAAEISGVDQDEMQKKRTALGQKYDQECDDPKFFLWKFGKQYLVPREVCSQLETAWKEDQWLLHEKVGEKKATLITKNEQRLGELLIRKLSDGEASKGKMILPGNILVGAHDYHVKRRLGSGNPSGGGHLKEINWLGESFALRTFYGDITALIPEISFILSLSHPNVMQYFCAFYDEARKEGFLLMELMSKDLGSYIKEHSGQRNKIPFSIPVAIDIMLQIARGMEYLHTKKIYHGDLNPSNILLKARSASSGSFQAKITGFGITSIKSCTTRSPKPTGVNLDIWLAPEVLAEIEQLDGKCNTMRTEKADVYSFGMLCFELLTGKVPFEDSHLQGEKMVRNILAGERPLFSYPSPKYLANLTKKCWQTNPNLRPSFSSICRILRYIKKILVINPDHGDPDSAPPLVDYCDMETGYLKKFPSEGGWNLAPVIHIPFQMFTYKIVEKERISGKKWGLTAEELANLPVFDDEQMAAMDDLFLEPGDQRSVFSEIIDTKNSGMAMDARTVISETQATTARPQENGTFASTTVAEKLEKNKILGKKKLLRLIVDQKPVHAAKTCSPATENRKLAEIPETKRLQNAESIQKIVVISSTNETKPESTTKSNGKTDNFENSRKRPTLMRKLKAIKTKLIPETQKHDSPATAPARMKKPMFSSTPTSSPSRALMKSTCSETPNNDLLKSPSTIMKTTLSSSSPASSPSRAFKKSETPKNGLRSVLPAGMKITIPRFSLASSPSKDFSKWGNPKTPQNDSPKFSPKLKKPISAFSPISSPSRAFTTCASPSHISIGHSKDYPSPISSPMNPNLRSSRLGRQNSLPVKMNSRGHNIGHV